MKKKQKPVNAYTFPNGMLMVFDEKGKQVPKYQGTVEEKLSLLLKDYPEVLIENCPECWYEHGV